MLARPVKTRPENRRQLLASPLLAIALLCAAALGLPAASLLAQESSPSSERPDTEPTPLRILQAGAPSGLDPHVMDTVAGHSVLANLYEALVETDARGQIQPALALSWQQPGARRWIFELRPDVLFHDGSPLTAADVVASLERAKNHPRSQVASYVTAIDSVRAAGARRIEIETRHPTPTLLAELSNVRIVPKGAPEHIEQPVGTGPYRLLDYLPGHGVGLQAFDGHWRKAPAEPRVDYLFLSSAAERVQWLVDGRGDLMQKLEVDALERVEKTPGVEVRRQRSPEVFYVHLNAANPPFDDRRVRCAVDLAIDRQALARSLLGGHAEPAGQLVGTTSFGYSSTIEATRVDRERARALLAEADARGATLVLYHAEGAENVATVLREHLATVGIRVALKGLPWHEFFDLMRNVHLPAYLAGWSESTFDASNVFESLVHSPDAEHGFGDMNFTAYSRPAIDRRIERAEREMDPERRRRLLEEISEQVREDCAFLPLVWPYEHYGVRSDLEWTPRLDGLLRAVDMRRRSR